MSMKMRLSKYFGLWVYDNGKDALKISPHFATSNVEISILEKNGGGESGVGDDMSLIPNSPTSYTYNEAYTFSFDSSTSGTLEYGGKSYNITKLN